MNDLRSLIEAAKTDGPSTAAKAKVWAGVSGAVGGAASLSGGGTAAAGSAGAMKMLLLGTLLGGTFTVGIGATMLFVGGARPVELTGVAAPAPATAPPQARQISLSIPEPAAPSNFILGSTVTPSPEAVLSPVSANAGPPVEAARRPNARSTSAASMTAGAAMLPSLPARTAQDDALAREASLLASARNALVRRDALTALQIVRGLSALPTRQLAPEELAVEAQALRGLGLADQADAVDANLRARFPDSVLGR
jgi:hypothetical protein